MIKDLPESEKTIILQLPLAFIIIAKYENGNYSFIASEMVNWEKLIIEVKLEKGIYHIFAKSYWNSKTNYDLVISSYSDCINQIENLKYEDIPRDWLTNILSNMGRRTGIIKKNFD